MTRPVPNVGRPSQAAFIATPTRSVSEDVGLCHWALACRHVSNKPGQAVFITHTKLRPNLRRCVGPRAGAIRSVGDTTELSRRCESTAPKTAPRQTGAKTL